MSNSLIKNGLEYLKRYFSIANFVILALLIAGFIIRLHFLTYPILLSDDADSSRDFLIARHIAVFHQFPQVGPWNNAFHAFINSPLYYYWLAFFLLFRDSLVFLGIVNIFLQLASGVIIFYLGKRMFGLWSGLWAMAFFVFSQINITQSRSFWQPYAMQPFLLGSMLLLWMAYEKKKNVLLNFSVVLLVCSIAIHNSALAAAPVLCSCTVYILFKNKAKLIDMALVFASGFCTLFLCYASVLVAGFNRGWQNVFSRSSQTYRVNNTLSFRLFDSAHSLIMQLFPRLGSTGIVGFVSGSVIFVLGILLFVLFFKFNKEKRFIISILVLLGLTSVFLAVVFRLKTEDFYFTASFPAVFLLMGAIVGFSDKDFWMRGLKLICGIGIVFALMPNDWNSPGLFLSQSVMQRSVESIIENVKTLGGGNPKNISISTYTISPYNPGQELPIHSALFWAPLEKIYKEPLTVLDDDPAHGLGYKPLYQGTLEFFICRGNFNYPQDLDTCQKQLDYYFPKYKNKKVIFSSYPFIIYSAQSD